MGLFDFPSRAAPIDLRAERTMSLRDAPAGVQPGARLRLPGCGVRASPVAAAICSWWCR